MEYRTTGRTGIDVSILGFGAGHIGSPQDNEREIEETLNYTLDCGINLIDTARGYGLSEERIGKYICRKRRKDAVICTKVGYGVEGIEDWTYECVVKGVERALSVMQTDYIDIVLLHTCPEWILRKYDVVHALLNVKSRGLVRAIGYSGDNEDLEFAVGLGDLDIYEGSFNIYDQKKSAWVLDKIKSDNKSFIAKRPIANAPWRFKERPTSHYCEPYWERMEKLGLFTGNSDPTETALRYAAFTNGVTSVITGTTSKSHLDQNIAYINSGALTTDKYEEIKNKYFSLGGEWRSEV